MKLWIITLAFVFSTAQCWAESKTYHAYDKQGNPVGMVRETKYGKYYFDGDRHYLGHARKNIDGSQTVLGEYGSPLGRITCVGDCDKDEDKEDSDD